MGRLRVLQGSVNLKKGAAKVSNPHLWETNENVQYPGPDISLRFRFHLQFECGQSKGFTLNAKKSESYTISQNSSWCQVFNVYTFLEYP